VRLDWTKGVTLPESDANLANLGFARAMRTQITWDAPSPDLENERKQMLGDLDQALPDLQRQMDGLQTASATDDNAASIIKELKSRMDENS